MKEATGADRGRGLGKGVLVGAAVSGLIVVTCVVAWSWLRPAPPYNVEVLVNGADMTRLGGRQLVIEYGGGVEAVMTVCKGPCDDLGYRLRTGASARVSVLDGRGACIACSPRGYADTLATGHWHVAGREKLNVDPWYSLGRDPSKR